MKRRNKLLLLSLLLLLAGCVVLERANRVPAVVIPADVTKQRVKAILQGQQVSVDLYLPKVHEKAPLVVLVHGFMRNREVMAGWGVRLAQEGMVVAAINTPFFSNHVRNAQAVVDTVGLARDGRLVPKWKAGGTLALMGHSAGGFATLLASAQVKPTLWIGLDPVDFFGKAEAAAREITTPGLALLAEPGAWNRHGNVGDCLNAYAGPMLALRVKDSTHCDPEDPSTVAAEWACGERDPGRLTVYQKYALAALRHHLMNNPAGAGVMDAAGNDPTVDVLRSRAAER